MPIPLPNVIGMLPGMTAMATMMMTKWMKRTHVPKLSELLSLSRESGVKLIACQMTMGVMGVEKDDLIDGLEIGGAATFLEFASHNAITLTF
jgi:peroxiredoxin family protein